MALGAMGAKVIPEVEARMAGACAAAGVSVVDIVGEAFSYVVDGVLRGRVPALAREEDLCRVVAAKALNLLRDACRAAVLGHGRRSIRVRESMDAVVGEGAREVADQASFADWQQTCREEEQAHQYRVCWQVLDQVCAMRGISPANLRIFKAVVLHERSRVEVAAQFGTSRNNVDQIVHRVTKWLREDGPGLYRAFYDEAA